MATTYNFPDHIKGDTMQAVNFTVTVNSSALDLTGATIKMDLRTSNGNLRKRFSSVDDDGISITNAAGGVFSVLEQIIDVPAMTYNYDIEITLSDDTVNTYISGTWTILQDQTYD